MASKSGVYVITCYGNEKFYIGSSVNINARKSSHFSKLRLGKHTNKHLQHAFNKYGEESFYFDIVEECDSYKVLEVEQKWLSFLKPHESEYGMNNSPTASNTVGFRHSEKTKEILSELAKNRDHSHLRAYSKSMIGKPSPRAGVQGRKWTDEEKQSFSEKRQGSIPWNKGIPHSPETIAKIKNWKRPSKYTDKQVETCVGLRKEGYTLKEIECKTGIPFPTVHRLLSTYEKKVGVTK